MKAAVIGILSFFISIAATAQELATVDFMRNLNDMLSQAELWKTGPDTTHGLPFFPGVYLSRRRATYVTFGLMINNINDEEGPEGKIAPSFDSLFKSATLLKAAFFVRRNKTNVALYFDYYRDDTWGLSARLRF